MIDPQSCAAELRPLYVVVFRSGFIGLLTTCIAIALLTILASGIGRDPGPPRRRR